MKRLKIPGVNNGLDVLAEEIMRVEAISNYSRVYFSNGSVVVVAKVLHWFEDVLPPEMFTRVHRSHLVNRMFVDKMIDNGANQLLLMNGAMIAISRRKMAKTLDEVCNLSD